MKRATVICARKASASACRSTASSGMATSASPRGGASAASWLRHQRYQGQSFAASATSSPPL